MTKQCEVLDTITIDHMIWWCYESCTNKDGMIFLMYRDDNMKCFDPFGEKQLTEIKDMDED